MASESLHIRGARRDLAAAAQAAASDPLEALQTLADARTEVEQATAELVAQARQHGSTWQQIADALEVTRQAVHARYGPRPGPRGVAQVPTSQEAAAPPEPSASSSTRSSGTAPVHRPPKRSRRKRRR